MTLEQKINEMQVRKILVVDDKSINIDAAKQYFSEVEKLGVKVEYASSAKEAKDKIKAGYEAKEKYSLVLSDLAMEEEKSGLEVMREAFRHFGQGFLVTGFNYDGSESHGHGPSTTVYPSRNFLGTNLKGKKESPEIWGLALEAALEYLESPVSKALARSMARHEKYVGEPLSDGLVEIAMTVYDDRVCKRKL